MKCSVCGYEQNVEAKFCSHCGHSLNHESHDELRHLGERIKDLETLVDINLFLSSTLDLNTLLNRVVDVSKSVLKAEAATLMLLDEGTQELTFDLVRGESADILQSKRLKLGEGIAGKVAKTGQPILVEDAKKDPDHARQFDELSGFQTRSVLCVPMKVKEKVIGVLEILNRTGDRLLFNEEDVERAFALANVAAVSVENAKLYDEIAGALKEIQRLEESKSQFISIISHELRTPLVPIKGYATMLLKSLEKLDPASRGEFLETIVRQADHLNMLISDLLFINEIENIRFRLERETISIEEILGEALKVQKYLGSRHEISLAIPEELKGDPEKLKFYADRHKMIHVFSHLINNAIKFSPKGGKVALSVERVGDRFMKVIVADQGVGFGEDQYERIFEKFYQIDSSNTRKFGGTGSGLYICKRTVESHGGTIGCVSKPGEGSTFTVQIPLVTPDPNEQKERKTPSLAFRRG